MLVVAQPLLVLLARLMFLVAQCALLTKVTFLTLVGQILWVKTLQLLLLQILQLQPLHLVTYVAQSILRALAMVSIDSLFLFCSLQLLLVRMLPVKVHLA